MASCSNDPESGLSRDTHTRVNQQAGVLFPASVRIVVAEKASRQSCGRNQSANRRPEKIYAEELRFCRPSHGNATLSSDDRPWTSGFPRPTSFPTHRGPPARDLRPSWRAETPLGREKSETTARPASGYRKHLLSRRLTPRPDGHGARRNTPLPAGRPQEFASSSVQRFRHEPPC